MSAWLTELVLPGLFDSGPTHWQTIWCETRADCSRVELGQWDRPTPDLWASRVDRAVARAPGQVVLVAHSLGCHAVAWWAAQASISRLQKVKGALLVAPPDVDRIDGEPRLAPFAPTPQVRLPFAATLVASHDDHYASFERSEWMARCWRAQLVDVGCLGHINAESALGDWPQGQAILRQLKRDCALLHTAAPAAATIVHPPAPRPGKRL